MQADISTDAELKAQLESLRALEFEDAAAYLQAATVAVTKAEHSQVPALQRAQLLSELGNARRINGEFQEAAAALDEALVTGGKLDSGPDREAVLALTHLRRAIVGDLTGAIVNGVDHLDQASSHFAAIKDADGLARCDLVRGALYLRIEEFEESERSFRRALQHYRDSGQLERIGVVQANLSMLYRYLDRIDDAVAAGREAVSVARSTLLKATAAGNLAMALAEAGQAEEALEMIRPTESAIAEIGDPNYSITYWRIVATILLKMDRATEARDLLVAALTEAESRGYARDFTEVHGLLAEAYRDLRDFENAYLHQTKHHEMLQAQSRNVAASQLEVHKWKVELEATRAEAEQERVRRQRLTESVLELSSVNEQLAARALELEWSSYRDSLTELANRRYFDERLGDLTARTVKAGQDLSILVLDLDDFKGVNDRFGHLTGDEVLRVTAQILEAGTRRSDLVARLGGEEFAVLLTGGMQPAALHGLAEKIRQAFEQYGWNAVAPGLTLTVSIGAARLSEVDYHPLRLLKLADDRLYAAKRGGRNRVVSQDYLQGQNTAE